MIPFEFVVVLRGYEPRAVDAILTPAVAALEGTDARARAQAAAALRVAKPPVGLRGFDRGQVDGAFAWLAARLEGAPEDAEDAQATVHTAEFDVTLRGYDRAAVDRLVDEIGQALISGSVAARAEASALVGEAAFAVRLRGYDRAQVDSFLQQARRDLA